MLSRLQPLHSIQLEKSNSSSSVWPTGTIVDPNMSELVSSVSTMLHCFPSTDTRVLTNHGMLFLDEIEAKLAANQPVKYAAYEISSKQLVFVSGILVYPAINDDIVEFTSEDEAKRWSDTSDKYGKSCIVNSTGENSDNAGMYDTETRTNTVSVRVTANHNMYVQTGNSFAHGAGISVTWKSTPDGRQANSVKVPPRVVSAASLVEPACECLSTDKYCKHRKKCLGFVAFAENGIQVSDASVQEFEQHICDSLGITVSQIDAFLELYGFWLGDGALQYHVEGGYNCVYFHQVKESDAVFLDRILPECGLVAGVDYRMYNVSDGRIWQITKQQWFDYFDQHYGYKYTLSKYYISTTVSIKSAKHILWWVISCLSATRLQILLRGLRLADGHSTHDTSTIYTSSVTFRDEIVLMALCAGYTARIHLMYTAGTVRGYYKLGTSKLVRSIPPGEDAALYKPIVANRDSWAVFYVKPTAHAHNPVCYPVLPLQQSTSKTTYNASRDGRLWCINVEHSDHLIVAQRAYRENGVVTKTSRPIIIGNCQMMRDLDRTVTNKQVLKSLTYFNEENYTGKVVKDIPAVKTIYQFLKQVFEVGQFHSECCVISLVYINRLIGVTGVPLTASNWKPISISALVLAQKVWDDTPLINADFSILYPALTVKEINFLERKFLDLLEFKLSVSPSLYAQYYFELRSICEESALNFRPLTKLAAKKFEIRAHLSEEYHKDKHAYKRRTMTVDEINYKIERIILS